MKQQRLDGLADGIFAIVMTLLALELKVPVIRGVSNPSDSALLDAMAGSWTIFISLVLSFALLFTYWRAHHFIASVYAKNVTVGFANINAVFFFLITLVPFAAHFLGAYPYSHVAIAIYGVTVIAIGLSLFYMRLNVESSPEIETAIITKADRRSGYIRILFPVFAAALAILISYWNPLFSTIIFTVAILFNLLPASSNIIHHWLDKIFSDDDELLRSNHMSPMDKLVNNEEFICVPKSAVFDHHRFRESNMETMLYAGGDIATIGKSGKISKRGGNSKSLKRKKVKTNKAIDRAIEKEIVKEVKSGEVEDVIVKKGV